MEVFKLQYILFWVVDGLRVVPSSSDTISEVSPAQLSLLGEQIHYSSVGGGTTSRVRVPFWPLRVAHLGGMRAS